MKNKFFVAFFSIVILLFCYFVIPALSGVEGLPHASAQDFGLEETVKETPIAKSSPAEFVGTIIKYVLGILGVILVALIIYGGIVYATSAGNEERTKTGRNILTYAIIGIAICALAFVVTDYALRALFVGESREGAPTSQNPHEPYGYDYKTAYGSAGCGRQDAGCWYDLNCCTGYECDTSRGTADPTDNIPTGWCVRQK
ncbi:MAG: pilin [Patescibacteria group bacterium]